MKYFFDQDDSSHWYMIPAERRVEWNKAKEMDMEIDYSHKAWCDAGWDDYRTGGGISDIEFTIPQDGIPISQVETGTPLSKSLKGCPFHYCDRNPKCEQTCRYDQIP
jgi:hypothetical protein